METPAIYTKAGDLGFTGLLGGGPKVPKWNKKIRAYGAVDELNAHIGRIRELLSADLKNLTIEIQQTLFVISSWLSRADYKSARSTLTELTNQLVENLETSIDRMTAELPPLRNFILISGAGTSEIHIARTVCRRAEADVVEVVYENDALEYPQYGLAIIYLNRLSDWLFTAARHYAHTHGQNDILVKHPDSIITIS